MPRYFFSVRTDGDLAVDTEGTDLPDLATARREAEKSLRELLADAIKAGTRAKTPDSVVVFDSSGAEVYIISLQDILPRQIKL